MLQFMYILVLVFMLFQAALARLEALENDNAGMELVENIDDEDASLDDDDLGQYDLIHLFI